MAGMNMQEMMKQARKMQEQLAQAQESMKDVTIDASAGGGMVKATVNGDLELVSIQMTRMRSIRRTSTCCRT